MFVLGMMSAAVALAVWAKPPEVGHRDAVLSLEGVGEVLEVAEGAGGGDLADRRIAFSQPIRDLVQPCVGDCAGDRKLAGLPESQVGEAA